MITKIYGCSQTDTLRLLCTHRVMSMNAITCGHKNVCCGVYNHSRGSREPWEWSQPTVCPVSFTIYLTQSSNDGYRVRCKNTDYRRTVVILKSYVVPLPSFPAPSGVKGANKCNQSIVDQDHRFNEHRQTRLSISSPRFIHHVSSKTKVLKE